MSNLRGTYAFIYHNITDSAAASFCLHPFNPPPCQIPIFRYSPESILGLHIPIPHEESFNSNTNMPRLKLSIIVQQLSTPRSGNIAPRAPRKTVHLVYYYDTSKITAYFVYIVLVGIIMRSPYSNYIRSDIPYKYQHVLS